VQYATIKAAII